MKYKLQAFFSGRNGLDQLSRALLWPALVLLLVSSFISVNWLQIVLYWLALVTLFYAYFRVFSRKLEKRRRENEAFLSRWNYIKQRIRQRKTHCFFRCPGCRQRMRAPRGKGTIRITCRKCGEQFEKRT